MKHFYPPHVQMTYCIAENFLGIKLLQIHPKNHFLRKYCHSILYHTFYNFADFSRKSRENRESYWPQKFLAIWYAINTCRSTLPVVLHTRDCRNK